MITRTCRGKIKAVVMLNSRELRSLMILMDMFLSSDETDEIIPHINRIMGELPEKILELLLPS